MSTRISKCRLVDRPAFARAATSNEARAARQRRNLEQVGLILDAEEVALALPGYVFTAEKTLCKFRILDNSVLGACSLCPHGGVWHLIKTQPFSCPASVAPSPHELQRRGLHEVVTRLLHEPGRGINICCMSRTRLVEGWCRALFLMV